MNIYRATCSATGPLPGCQIRVLAYEPKMLAPDATDRLKVVLQAIDLDGTIIVDDPLQRYYTNDLDFLGWMAESTLEGWDFEQRIDPCWS